MVEKFRKFHTLDIWINGIGPFTAASQLRGGLSATLLYTPYEPLVSLFVNIKIDEHTTKHYRLRTLRPGDRIQITYDSPNDDGGRTIEEIEQLTDAENYSLPDGLRIGFDVHRPDGEKVRLSHPEGGGFNLMLANVPMDHARVGVSAGNDEEEWNWQLDDLYAGDSLGFEIIATDWCDPFPRVERRRRE